MMYVLRDAQGHLQASIDYYLVNDQGQVTFDGTGQWVWVQQLDLDPTTNGHACIRTFIDHIAEAIPQAVGAYWFRKDKTGMTPHTFTRTQLVGRGECHATV